VITETIQAKDLRRDMRLMVDGEAWHVMANDGVTVTLQNLDFKDTKTITLDPEQEVTIARF
jgi:hypothetical protein